VNSVKYQADKNFIYLIDPPYTRKDEIKQNLSGVWFDTQKRGKGWRFPRTLHAYRELWKAMPQLKNLDEFINDGKLANQEVEYWKSIKNEKGWDDDRLREYQKQDANYLKNRGSCLVLNEPRTGKTPTMITVLKAMNSKVNIVICPSSLVLNWAKEFKQWYPEMKVYPVVGTPKQRNTLYIDFQSKHTQPKVLVISKDTWKKDESLHTLEFGVAIVDEAHFLRNYKSKQSEAIFALKANVKYALTGTPSVKHGSDVYGLLHFINPEAFPSYWQFTDRYWNINDNGWGKDVAEPKGFRSDELLTIMNMNSVQRKRKDVMKWLPAATYQTIPVQMGKKQTGYYDKMMDTFEVWDEKEEHGVDTLNVLSQLMRLRQICLDPRLLGFKEVGAKTTALLEFAEEMNEPFVVMTMFSSYFELVKDELEKLGKKVAVIDGSVSKTNRNKIVERFQSGKIDILLANIVAAGVGLTLDRSDTIVFMDKSFSPADNEQAQDRIVPTTKEKYHPINILSFVCEGTVDERINDILERKEDLTKLINKPEIFREVVK
jgi:SNF2 family DNA or RNA helicase